jgi:subtilisin family serine protease
MKTIKICFVALSILALAFLPMSTIGQSIIGDRIIYPPQFSPLVTSRPPKTQRSLVPGTKFVKVQNAIPNRYVVVLNDDVVSSDAALSVRRARITAIANSHALAYLGKVGYIYETALKGYSIELPNEAAAMALSENPLVKWVEEDAQLNWLQSEPEFFQSTPPWGLDAIDGSIPAPTPDANGRTNGIYIYNATGSGVTAYVLDSGINTRHQEFFNGFFSRAYEAADCFTYVNCQSGALTPFYNQQACVFPMPNASNNDCHGHGTHVAGTLGGSTYGAAKEVTIRSVKVGSTYGTIPSAIIAGINWVMSDHQANPSIPAVANMSLGGSVFDPNWDHLGIDTAVSNSIAAGVIYVVAAGNSNADARNTSPADVAAALTVGAVDWTGSRPSFSNWGPGVDLFAPGVYVVSALTGNFMPCAWDGTNTSFCANVSGTSQASPHVAGAVAMYLQGRTGTAQCNSYPIQGTASPLGGAISTCPDRVVRFIDSNANLSKLSNVNITDSSGNVLVYSPNRFLWTVSIPATANPVDNQRFFTWEQYSDFLTFDPDEGGLDFWTRQITGPLGPNCNVGINDNNSCARTQRALVSKEFFRAAYPSAFNNNSQFVHQCYVSYLRRSVPDSDQGFQFWLGQLNSYGTPASEAGKNALIDAFITSGEYRLRFGQA